ncbi:helix-turn-helix transcriptional regulator [Geomonas propionica]|uniref:AlpA family phage regulatory protein n=1 Tax=Geomonas propionica TaxID=2798582 RepID=A0ABS0YP27_9BACT|nr:AlpA family phage regulatory protein [Geomonas propionica]MBJ6799736.1 AlpA family phage regulatory protein [Geomonas propionica]
MHFTAELRASDELFQALAEAITIGVMKNLDQRFTVLESALAKAREGKHIPTDNRDPKGTTSTSKVLTRRQVLKILGVSGTTLWRMEQSGTFPKGRQISTRRVGYLEADVEAWMQNRQAA